MRRCFSRLQYVLFAALAVLPAMAAANAPCTVGTFQALGLPNTLILVVEALDAGTYPSPSHPAPSPVGTGRALPELEVVETDTSRVLSSVKVRRP